jgi:TRAP-type mannitol/chloroaromatic compound transport system substrate-binding protein
MLTNSISKDIGALESFKDKGIDINYLDPQIQKNLYQKAVTLLDAKAAKDPYFSKVWESQKTFRARYNAYDSLMTPQYE